MYIGQIAKRHTGPVIAFHMKNTTKHSTRLGVMFYMLKANTGFVRLFAICPIYTQDYVHVSSR